MRSLGSTHLLMLLAFVVLVLDSRRFHALARLTGRGRPDTAGGRRQRGLPPGAHPDQVGLPLRQIQMRINIDWQDGGIGWDGPEILPADEFKSPETEPATETAIGTGMDADPEPSPFLPVLWKPYPALLLGEPLPVG